MWFDHGYIDSKWQSWDSDPDVIHLTQPEKQYLSSSLNNEILILGSGYNPGLFHL